MPKVRGGNPECQAATAQRRQRGATPCPKSGAAAGRSNPMSNERRLRGHGRAERSYSTFKVRRGDLVQVRSGGCPFWSSCEEIPHVQVKRNPSKMVLREGIRGQTHQNQISQSDHRTTVLSDSVKLSHAMWGHPRRSGHGGEV